jgi:dihydrofolate reductase
MRKLKYFTACSADGYIARPDDSWDGIMLDGIHTPDLQKVIRNFDVVLIGTKTFQAFRRQGIELSLPNMKTYVFSDSSRGLRSKGVSIVTGDAAAKVISLKKRAGKDIWLVGGGGLASILLKEKLIDEIILKVSPVLFTEGQPLFEGGMRTVCLDLDYCTKYDNGVVLAQYRIAY